MKIRPNEHTERSEALEQMGAKRSDVLVEYIFVTEGPSCTGCKSSSPAVANCFSCSALLCANCVIAHQLMVAFEVSVLFYKDL